MKLTDASEMEFGQHKGKPLDHVPADYLLWLGDELEPSTEYKKALLVYIAENRECLEKEKAGEL